MWIIVSALSPSRRGIRSLWSEMGCRGFSHRRSEIWRGVADPVLKPGPYSAPLER